MFVVLIKLMLLQPPDIVKVIHNSLSCLHLYFYRVNAVITALMTLYDCEYVLYIVVG